MLGLIAVLLFAPVPLPEPPGAPEDAANNGAGTTAVPQELEPEITDCQLLRWANMMASYFLPIVRVDLQVH
jgi:hypothetical protein